MTERATGLFWLLAVLDRLDQPLRIETVPRKNRHEPGQIDTLRTYHYAGLRFTVYDVTGDAKEIMQSITVTGSTYATVASNRLRVVVEEGRATRLEWNFYAD